MLEASIMSFFVERLNVTLQGLVWLLRPKCLGEAYALAELHEDVIHASPKLRLIPGSKPNQPSTFMLNYLPVGRSASTF